MKKTLLLFTVLLVSITNFAQNDAYLELAQEILNIEKKEAIAEVMKLNDTQKSDFWALYNEYEILNSEVKNKRISLVKNYAANYEYLTPTKADELANQYFAFEQADLKLKKKYYKKMKKVIPATEAAKFIQATNKIDNLISAELALEIPLIETK